MARQFGDDGIQEAMHPGFFDRVRNVFRPQQRSALLPSMEQVWQMSAWYSAAQNMVPQTTLNNKIEPIGSGFRELAAGAYAGNPIVFSCMLARVQLFSEARFQFQKMVNGVPGELFGKPETYLRLLENPWPGGTTSTLLKELLTDADLGGNAFVARRQNQLQRLRPDWTVIIAGSPNSDATTWDLDTEILGYGYQPDGPAGGKDWIILEREQVAHFRPVPDPLRRFSGMSWLVPVIREIMGDQAATAHKLNYFEHGATPNLIVKFDQIMPKAQAKDWIELFSKDHEGARNAYKTLFLGGGSDAMVVGANLQQVDFAKVQAGGELRIASAAGVPPIIVGLSGGLDAATYSNYGQARRAFADLTMRPLWRDVCGALQNVTQTPAESRLWFDATGISFLQEDVKDAADIQQVQAAAIRTLIDAGYQAETVIKAITNNNWSLLSHTGLFSVQLQPAGTLLTPKQLPAGEVLPPKALAAPAKPLMNSTSSSPITGEIRCSSCNRLLAEMATAPYRLSCPRCKNVTSAGLAAA